MASPGDDVVAGGRRPGLVSPPVAMSLTTRPPDPPLRAPPPPPDRTAPARPTTTRREFAATLAITALGACVGRTPGAGTTTSPAPATPAPPPTGPAPEPAAAPAATTPPDAATEALVAAIAARYGTDVVPAAARGAFREAVGRTVELSRRLQRPPVANAVDPFSSLYPAPAPARARRRAP